MRTLVLAGVLVFAWTGASLAQDAAAGQQTFMRFCLPCHDAGENARIKLGPPLSGIDGRKAGTFECFNYSDAMKNSGITWGTRMAFTGLKDEKDRADLWAFLSSIKADGTKK